MAIIDVRDLRRQFTVYTGSRLRRQRSVVAAVDGVSFRIEAGEAVGYIGANGSGKSTTIKMLTGILVPSSGTLRVCGFDPVPNRRALAGHLGVLFRATLATVVGPAFGGSYPILAAMHRRPEAVWRRRLTELVDGLELGNFLNRPVRQLSLGQRMRGELAAALIHEPELIVLDEPTIGLDMISKERLRAFLKAERARRGTTLVLTTHDMGDVQRLCDRMIIIDHGRKVFDGDQAALATHTGAERILQVDAAAPVNAASLRLPAGAHLVSVQESRLRIGFAAGQLSAATLLEDLSNQLDVVDLALSEPDIEHLVRQLYSR